MFRSAMYLLQSLPYILCCPRRFSLCEDLFRPFRFSEHSKAVVTSVKTVTVETVGVETVRVAVCDDKRCNTELASRVFYPSRRNLYA